MRAELTVLTLLAGCSSAERPIAVRAPLPEGQHAVLVLTDDSGRPISDPMLFASDVPLFRLSADAGDLVRLFALTFESVENGGPDLPSCTVTFDEGDPPLPSPSAIFSTEPVRLNEVDTLELAPHHGAIAFKLRSTCDPCGTKRTELDRSFGRDGTALISMRGVPLAMDSRQDKDHGYVIAVDLEGRILFGGESYVDETTGFDFALVRLLADGSLDPSFGTAGKLLAHPFTPARIRGLLVDRAGRIVVAGFDGDNRLHLSRFTDAGELDPSFGRDGWVLTSIIYSSNLQNQSLAFQSDGKIVLGGANQPGTTTALAIARYGENGVLDPTFGVDGIALVDPTEGRDYVTSLRIQEDDRIVAGGVASSGETGQFLVARLNADGSIDPSFNANGVVVLDVGTSGALGVAIQPDGKILAVGSTRRGPTDASQVPQDSVLVRLSSEGRLDSSFGEGGIAVVSLDGFGFDAAYEVVARPDGGGFYVSGAWQDVNAGTMFVARFRPDASLDTCFGEDGIFSDYESRFDDRAHSLVRLEDGSLLAGGCSECAICADCPEFGDFVVFKIAP